MKDIYKRGYVPRQSVRKGAVALALIMLMGAMLPAIKVKAESNQPYSMYGYGLLSDRATAMQRQMGGTGVAMNSGRQINVMNPASYAAIDSLTFLFDLGADVTLQWQKEGAAREHSTGGGLEYLTMQFPIWKYMGASLGLLPYSSVGYAFGKDVHNGTLSNQGSGGINEAYIGFAGGYGGFTLGANVSYDFGNIITDNYTRPNTTGESLFERVMQVRDWNVLIGAQYSLRLAKVHKVTVGATFAPKKSLHGKTYATLQEKTQDARADTLGMMKMRNKYFTPNSVGAGINYTYEDNFRLAVEVDMQWQQWSKAKYSELKGADGQILAPAQSFNDRKRLSFGAEYTPRIRGNYGQRITYRLGAYVAQDYLKINNTGSLREIGASAGFGFPTPEGKTLINLGVEWKKRFTKPVATLTENYLNITLGINFNEVWFWQRKIR